jgi:hypothetical protein
VLSVAAALLPSEGEEWRRAVHGLSGDARRGAHGAAVAYAVRSACDSREVLVVFVDKDAATRGAKEVVELALGADDTLERSESLEVRTADVGDQATVWSGDGAEVANLAGVIRAHFDDGHLVRLREAKQRKGYADVVVEVALGAERAETSSEDGGHELLRRRLAVRAGDADDGRAERLAMQSGEALQGIEDAVDAKESGIVRQRGIIHDGASAAVAERLQGKGVTVEVVAFECEKEAAGRHASAVGRDGWVTQKEGVKVLRGHILNGITKNEK